MFSSIVLFLLTLFTRFFGFNWGNGFFFHPDENNMATAITQLSWQNLNPHFFAYGQFPLYLGYFSLKTLGLANTFFNSVYILRFWSAVFSCFSILFFYHICRSKIFTLLLVFTPGLIQLAHFGTTESLLIFVFAVNLYLSQLIIRSPKPKYFFLASVVTGIGLATKISAIIFITPVLLATLFNKDKNKLHLLLFTIYCLLFTFLFFIIFSPYNLIAHADFLSSLHYETQVATGKLPVFYTNQFLHTSPYFFQLTKIFPYIAGLPMFIFSSISFCLILKSYFIDRKSFNNLTIVLLSCLVYFLYFGQVYTKWTRFMSPIFFIFPFLTTVLLEKINNINKKNIFITYLNKFIIVLSIIPGIMFMKIYFQPDVRLIASRWMVQAIPANSKILSEAGNVINLPITDLPAATDHQLQVTNFDFYNLDTNTNLQPKLTDQIGQSDYIIIPSRRIFKNQNNSNFPVSQQYYQQLFSGQLGFSQIKQFSVFNDENAEETWSVFDHPVVRIFQRNYYD